MGKHRFRFSDMIPNSWIYKLKYITTTTKNNPTYSHPATTTKPPSPSTPKPLFSPHRSSYYYSAAAASPVAVDFPRRSKRRPRRRSTSKSSSSTTTTVAAVSAGCSCKAVWAADADADAADFDPLSPLLIRADERLLPPPDDYDGHDYDHVWRKPGTGLRPISTRPTSERSDLCKTQTSKGSFGAAPVRSPALGMRLRAVAASPRVRVQHRRSSATARRRRSEGFAVVKASTDPQRDFRESMVEMIVENNMRDSKDLEELLACYLSLNSDEYHDVIIKVFQQIWFDLTDIRS
ncbi:hypothetical protein QJS10_CPA03g00966 [Acorus calamus]|uniref:Transcription repressor n=1 Tax=Acorus calamus TaxID=4465 RepID=A0AAV9F571_ACOCL|nr:hypothetical protein QJS10_CPA03g00966 [Acorus calamus]